STQQTNPPPAATPAPASPASPQTSAPPPATPQTSAPVVATPAPASPTTPKTIAPASATPVPGPTPDILQKYTPVTADRLKNPEDGNWPMFRRSYNGWGYSPLNQITRANVSRLQPVWSFSTGQVEGHQAPPIVNNGVMFVATPGNQVIALEAKSGK